ncbi:hypothetical protein BDZ94DRAFT_1311289 [Collybia nuda]|uniref:Uncharacterized protein n=1 Tax=Collybia nuda TaxID=64659 RepID=A0A9P5Y1Q5_9AGAR|nr:hypothetical protein BDZ94DRAFT_1311289 [Collybia nuda]
MDFSHILAFGVFALYFVVVFALFTIIFWSILGGKGVSMRKTWGFGFLMLGSLIHTQFYMFEFMLQKFNDYKSLNPSVTSAPVLEQLSSWLLNASLLEEYVATIRSGPMNWWWAEQLPIYTVVWTLFLVVLGRSNNIKHLWAYMLLGHLVAHSVASNLFYLALISPTRIFRASKPPNHVVPLVFVPLCLSFLPIAIAPHVNSRTFIAGYLPLHVTLMVPLLVPFPFSYAARRATIRLGTLVTFVSIVTALIRFRTDITTSFAAAGRPLPSFFSLLPPRTLFVLPSSLSHQRISSYTIPSPKWPDINIYIAHFAELASSFPPFVTTVLTDGWHTLNSHPIQRSIGWDVIWTSISLGAWVLSGGDLGSIVNTDEKRSPGGKKASPAITGKGRAVEVRKPVKTGRGLFAPLVGIPGLVSWLAAPWAARVGEVHVKWQAGGVLRVLKDEVPARGLGYRK